MFIKKIIVFIITFLIFILFSDPMFVYASDDILSCDVHGGGGSSFGGGSTEHESSNGDIHGGGGGSFGGGSTEHESSSGDIHGGDGGSFDEDKINKTDGVSFSFTFLEHDYTFNIPFLNEFMPIVRDIIFYFLLAKSVFTKFKSLPAIIGQVPVIGPSDSQQVAMYNIKYGK